MNLNISPLKISILTFLIVILPIFLYYINFRSLSISDDPLDWAAFGSYIGGVYAFISFVALLLLTMIANRINRSIADVQIRQNVYMAYFEQINFLFFDVVKKYKKYEENKGRHTAVPLEESLFAYSVYIDNLGLETHHLNEAGGIKLLSKRVTDSVDSFKGIFSTGNTEEKKQRYQDLVISKTELVMEINRSLRLV